MENKIKGKFKILDNYYRTGIDDVLLRCKDPINNVKCIRECPMICNGNCNPCAKHWFMKIITILRGDRSFVMRNENHPNVIVILPPPYTNGYQIEIETKI